VIILSFWGGRGRVVPIGAILIAAALLTPILGAPAAASEQAWQALRQGGAVALVRHARAPGTGDPPGFRQGDCSTQRNLSAEGREQAKALGAGFAAERVQVARVLSSRWCRALDTASIAFGDKVEQVPVLDSFFDERGARESRTEALRRLVEEWSGRHGVLVLVTHQVNVTALTGNFVGEGEVLVLAPGQAGFTLVGRIRVPPS
jgi:broad specificity phosphatase PhoE